MTCVSNQLGKKLVQPPRYNRNLLGGERHIPVKTKVISNGTYIQYEGDGDTYFKELSLENYLKKMRYMIDII